PEVAVSRGEGLMHQSAHDVHVRITVGDHDPFGTGGGAAGVVDGKEIPLGDVRFDKNGGCGRDGRFIIVPARFLPFQRHKLLYPRQLVTYTIHRCQVITVGTHNPRSAMVDDVGEIVSGQAVVNGHNHGP